MRFYAEEMWTGLTTDPEKFELFLSQESWNETQLTSNPFRVKRLFTKLRELRARVKSLEKNVAFRPAVSQVRFWFKCPIIAVVDERTY